MPRSPREDPEGGWHHIYNRGARRVAVFLDDRDRHHFLDLLGLAVAKHAAEVHAYSLMTTHFHAMAHFPSGGLSVAMKELKSTYTRRFNDRHRLDGALFRGRFASKRITDESHAVTVATYIHRNPLDFLSTEELVGYRWSSYRYYCGASGRPPWLQTATVLGFAGLSASAYREEVTRSVTVEEASIATLSPRMVAELSVLEEVVGQVTGLERSAVRTPSRGATNEARLLALLAATERTSLSSRELALWLRPMSPSALRSNLQRARRLLAADGEFAAMYGQLLRVLDRAALGLAS